MPQVEITAHDLVKAQQQKALFEELLVDFQLNPEANADKISRIKEDISEIDAEARGYSLLLNPRARPRLCGTCNAHPFIDMPDTKCASCGLPLHRARPKDGVAHWVVFGEGQNIALPIGEKVPL